jgi:hypothetical protein
MPLNSIFAWFIKKRILQIDLFKQYPHEVQNELLQKLISTAKDTEWGKAHHFETISDYTTFKEKVPLQDYECLKPFVDRMFRDEQNILWPTEVKWFAKSSGTTSDKSKFIPVTRESLDECQYNAGKDIMSIYYNNYPEGKVYKGKHLIVGGSAELNELGKNSYFGDLSAIVLENLPWWAEMKRTPSKEVALMSDWEEKIERMAQETMQEDVYMIAGVPSWTLVLLNRILELTGKSNIKEVWPNLEAFMHGGVKFEPYIKEYKRLIPGKMNYIETYNASEGFFGIQDQKDSNELLLMLDYGIFFEFIPLKDFDGINSREVISLKDVKLNTQYALVISTSGGLWRYILGDVIEFTNLLPYRFRLTGRTTQFINAFGEELIIDNTDKAIAIACERANAQIRDYTLAPIYMENKNKGRHEWLIEFISPPERMDFFAEVLDTALKSLNSDYEAKRSYNLSLDFPLIIEVKKGIFDFWLKEKGKLGGQHKIPRLSNDRTIIEEIKQCALHYSS